MSIVSIVKFLHCNFKNFVLKSKHIKFFEKKRRNFLMRSLEPLTFSFGHTVNFNIFLLCETMFWTLYDTIFYNPENEDTRHLH